MLRPFCIMLNVFSDITGMEFKAYGMMVTLTGNSVTVKPTSRLARGAMNGDAERVILLKDIVYLKLVKGNIFVNHRIIIGDRLGKTYVPVVPWKDNYSKAEAFYKALYASVEPLHHLTDNAPIMLRNSKREAARGYTPSPVLAPATGEEKYTIVNMFKHFRTWNWFKIAAAVAFSLIVGQFTYAPIIFVVLLWLGYTLTFINNKATKINNAVNKHSELYKTNERKFGLQPYGFNPETETPQTRPVTGSQFDIHERPQPKTFTAPNESIPMTEYNDSMPPIVAAEYAIIDLETTGLSPANDRIIEVGIMIVDAAYNEVSRHETLINPKQPVKLTHVHGIDDRMVSGAPTIDQVSEAILTLLHNRIVVAHNASFEQRFLNNELSGKDLTPNNFLDTLKYGRRYTPSENHKLGTIAAFYGVPYLDSHTAMGDVIITRQVLAKMLPTNPNSQFIASEDLTPYFHAPLGDAQPTPDTTGWVSR